MGKQIQINNPYLGGAVILVIVGIIYFVSGLLYAGIALIVGAIAFYTGFLKKKTPPDIGTNP